jgi:chemotaxis protein MotB
MAAKRDETDGELIKSGKPGKPTKPPRGFPWRLWLFAIVMLAGSVAGGYFTWQYRSQAQTASEGHESCVETLAQTAKTAGDKQKVSDDAVKRATACEGERVKDAAKEKQLESQLGQLSTNLNASKEELATRRGSLVISLPSEVLFASGSADVSEKGQIAIIEIGVTLKKLTDRRFMVIGHTDDQPLKSSVFKDNWELSTARALMVTRTLVKAGMDAKNLIPAGAGEHDPLGKDRAKNRRIEIALLPAINELPPLPSSLETTEPPKP